MGVFTVWDVGVWKSDAMAVGFFQRVGKEVRMIDYLETLQMGLPGTIKLVKEKPYIFSKHFAPHDIQVSDYSLTGNQSRWEVAKDLGIEFEIVPNLSIQEGIDAGRRLFKIMYVDKLKCGDFLEAIPQYTREYDEDNKIFKDKPLHDWTSHYADEHRYASLVFTQFNNEYQRQQTQRVGEARANKRMIE